MAVLFEEQSSGLLKLKLFDQMHFFTDAEYILLRMTLQFLGLRTNLVEGILIQILIYQNQKPNVLLVVLDPEFCDWRVFRINGKFQRSSEFTKIKILAEKISDVWIKPKREEIWKAKRKTNLSHAKTVGEYWHKKSPTIHTLIKFVKMFPHFY